MDRGEEYLVYMYNENGLRVRKAYLHPTEGVKVTNYTWHGKNIVHMTQGSNNLHFYYDASGKPAMVDFNGVMYGYVHNLQGDIVAIVNSSGTVVVSYTYDAWGKPLSKTGTLASTLGTLNPFRYRGYVYDEETGLFYLRSRYYNAEWLRFVNADILLLPNFNLFGYCMQQPINRSDHNGTDFFDCCWDEMSNRSLWSPMHLGFAAPAYKGNTSGIWDPNGIRARVTAYNESWINSNRNRGDSTPAHNQTSSKQSKDKMKMVREKGKAGEAAVGYTKNTKHIPSLTETAAYRVPDILNDLFIGEVKNYSWPVQLTPQIIDEILYGDAMEIPFVLFTDAPLAPSLKQLHDNNVFILQNIHK